MNLSSLLSFPPSFSLLSLLPTIRSPFFHFACTPCLPSLSPASSLSFTHSLFNLVSHLLVYFYLILNASIFIAFYLINSFHYHFFHGHVTPFYVTQTFLFKSYFTFKLKFLFVFLVCFVFLAFSEFLLCVLCTQT